MEEIETSSTIFLAPSSGELLAEIDNQAVIPSWLVFPEHIFNCKHIIRLTKDFNNILIIETATDRFYIKVTDIEKTFSALQHVFTEGVKHG